MELERRRIRMCGVVQGVGFRPFVWRLAEANQLSGWIINDGAGILMEVQGPRPAIEQMLQQLQTRLPPLARIEQFSVQEVPLETDASPNEFEIRSSESDPGRANANSVPPDVAMCDECDRELFDAENRRYRYPFINCTNCGPRFTIIRALPYDRAQTTMARFALCPACQAEYCDPSDRRFHAQPNACPICGPRIWFELSSNGLAQFSEQLADRARESRQDSETAIQAARQLVRQGGVLAVKGIGGFHLACDARNEHAVVRLRRLKQRPDKPLAVMVSDLEVARQLTQIRPREEDLLSSPQRPIVLLIKRAENGLAASIAPRNPWIGLMLPYSPLHRLLLQPGECWVMTSGNRADEPIANENAEAINRLSGLCDGFVLHDRPIESVCDDSVVRVCGTGTIPIRRSRGFCPLPIRFARIMQPESDPVSESARCVLAVGGELKSAIALVHGNEAILGQHLGDLGSQESLSALEESVAHLLGLYQAQPAAMVADRHPGYQSTAWARDFAHRRALPFVAVQHHHAHAAALMAEHGLDQRSDSIIACVFDGTGFGNDGAIWGGEWLIASLDSFRRYGQLEYTPLPGGDSAIERPAKTALAQLFHYRLPWKETLACMADLNETERNLLRQQLEKKVNTVATSSMGRLFDCVASLIGLRQRVCFEGQAAMELEGLATSQFLSGGNDFHPNPDISPFKVVWTEQGHWVWNFKPMLEAILEELDSGTSTAVIAARFHRTLAAATRELCRRARAETTINRVGLTGGVFQNALLTQLLRRELEEEGFEVLTHSLVPPNDGGLALGQAVLGWWEVNRNRFSQGG